MAIRHKRIELSLEELDRIQDEQWNRKPSELIEEFFDSLTIQDDEYTAVAKNDVTIIVWQEQYAKSDLIMLREPDAQGREVLTAIVMPAFFIISDNVPYTVGYIVLNEDVPTKHTAIVHVPNVRIKLYVPADFTAYKTEGEGSVFVFNYKPEEYVFTIEQTVLTSALIVSNINKLYAYRKLDYPHRLLYILLDLIGDLAPVDLVHYEVFVSELIRCADDPKLPGRLCPEDKYVVMSQKRLPHIESPIRAIVFEQYQEAIMKILLGETKQELSTLDRLLLQDYEHLGKENEG